MRSPACADLRCAQWLHFRKGMPRVLQPGPWGVAAAPARLDAPEGFDAPRHDPPRAAAEDTPAGPPAPHLVARLVAP